MPTGYTADVADGKITDFKTFALRCARAFGATIMQRDDPMDDPPKKREETEYYQNRLKESVNELEELKALSLDACEIKSDNEYNESMTYYRKSVAKYAAIKKRYLSMLEDVESWEPPTENHFELKKFMREQLQKSLKFDCDYEPSRPKRKTAEEWKLDRMQLLGRNVEYYAKESQEEKERCQSTNKWIEDLENSLK